MPFAPAETILMKLCGNTDSGNVYHRSAVVVMDAAVPASLYMAFGVPSAVSQPQNVTEVTLAGISIAPCAQLRISIASALPIVELIATLAVAPIRRKLDAGLPGVGATVAMSASLLNLSLDTERYILSERSPA